MAHILSGQLTPEDFRISGEQLMRQAEAAEVAGYTQLGQNLRRAAELTALSNERVLEIYTALRPGRATHRRLIELADELADIAPLNAALIREAAQAGLERGVFAPTPDQDDQA